MNRLLLLALGAVAAMVLLSSTMTAQPASTRVVFVDSQALIAAHPAGQAAAALSAQAQAELTELRQQLEALDARRRAGQTLTNEESERFSILLTTFETVQVRYQSDIAAAAGPAVEAVNAAIRAVAQEREYGIVFDVGAAAERGLIVYAAEGLDITDEVMLRLGN
jgi:outer membrane protein